MAVNEFLFLSVLQKNHTNVFLSHKCCKVGNHELFSVHLSITTSPSVPSLAPITVSSLLTSFFLMLPPQQTAAYNSTLATKD